MRTTKGLLVACIAIAVWLTGVPATGRAEALRFDCGTATSPVMAGFQRLTADDLYNEARGYGWEGAKPRSVEFQNPGPLKPFWVPREKVFEDNLNDLNRDAVVSEEDLIFRADVPDGTYRVSLLIGDMSRAIGSIDVTINGELVAGHLAAWTPGGYRGFTTDPYGWWAHVRHTVEVKGGAIRIRLARNEEHYKQQMAEQSTWENPFRQWWPQAPEKSPPYFFIGYPFVENSIMATEIVPHVPAPVLPRDHKLELTRPISSRGLQDAISFFNQGDFAAAVKSLDSVSEPEARVAKAIVQLWLAGRPEVEAERTLVPAALQILRQYASAHPDENGVAEVLQDAEYFEKALGIHLARGQLGKNHFMENDKAIGWWWLIQEGSPLYYESQLYIARAGHMLRPYMPTLGEEAEILKKLEKKFPENRYVKYLLHWEWRAVGDGSEATDWHMVDYSARVDGSPPWVRELYPAFATLVDLAEWWFKHKQQPEGTIGGGWGDDVEIIGAFGYMGYVGRGASDLAIQGAGKLVEGVWNLSEVDPELGFCLPMADAEHTAEWTGNTLGMMTVIDYGNPLWIERGMKTGKLMRDLWTAYDRKGHRHFRSNFFSAAAVGSGNQMNDSWINYRAVAPAKAVLWYNRNPTISKLFLELADAWLAAYMSTERGKPPGIIPAEVSFPDGLIGGTNSPNWYTSSHTPGTVNYDWPEPRYKGLIQSVFLTAYEQTRDPRYLEPLRLEYELAAKYGKAPAVGAGRGGAASRNSSAPDASSEPGSEPWVAAKLTGVEAWSRAKLMLEGRAGKLQNRLTRNEIVRSCAPVGKELKLRWPLMTTEASATDRVFFMGWAAPLYIYAAGRWSDRYMEAAATHENTTREFAAAVMAADPQGLRIMYHSLAPDTREKSIVPWDIEPGGTYVLRYGPDANDDEEMDSVAEEREFYFPQRGTPIRLTVSPRRTYMIEVDQVRRGSGLELAPDPGLSERDIRYDERYGLLLVTVHNVGAKGAGNVEVAVYDGDPDSAGTLVGSSVIANIEAPNELQAQTVTVGFNWRPSKDSHDIYVRLDPKDEIKDEITSFNNNARKQLAEQKVESPARKVEITVAPRRGR